MVNILKIKFKSMLLFVIKTIFPAKQGYKLDIFNNLQGPEATFKSPAILMIEIFFSIKYANICIKFKFYFQRSLIVKKVLILGGGYAGLSFIKNLHLDALGDYQFTLISKENEHYTSILLHNVASAGKNITLAYEKILPRQIEFIQDEIKEIKDAAVVGKKAEYNYDILVIALGFSSDDFGIKGVKDYAHSMVNYHNSLDIHRKLETLLQEGQKDIVVCGAGFTGIELLGNLANDWASKANLHCVEAMPAILPMFDSDLAIKAKNYLEERGVNFELGAKILELKQNSVIVEKNGEQKELKSDFTFWTAGVKGNEVMQNSPFFKTARSKVEVNAFLNPIQQEKEMKNIFVLGDCAALKDEATGRFYPPTAQMAEQQGKYLAGIFNSNLTSSEPFSYNNKGTICSVGYSYAVGVIGGVSIRGILANYLKRIIEAKWILKLKF